MSEKLKHNKEEREKSRKEKIRELFQSYLLGEFLEDSFIEYAKANYVEITSEEVKLIFFKEILFLFKKGKIWDIKYLTEDKDFFGIKEEDIQQNENIKDLYLEGLTFSLKEKNTDNVKFLLEEKNLFGIKGEDIQGNCENVKEFYLGDLASHLNKGDIITAQSFLKEKSLFGIKEEDIQQNENIKSAYLTGIAIRLENGYVYKVKKFLLTKSLFGIKEEDIQQNENIKSAYLAGVILRLMQGQITGVEELLKKKEVIGIKEEDIQQNEKISPAYFEGIISCLKEGQIYEIREFLEKEQVLGIKDKDIKVNQERIKLAYFEGIIFRLENQNFDDIDELLAKQQSLKIKGREIKKNKKIKLAYLNSLNFSLEKGRFFEVEKLLEIRSFFEVDEEKIRKEIIKEYKSDLKPYIELIKKETSWKEFDFLKMSFRDLLILFKIKNHFLIKELSEHLFFIEVMKENSRFGLKLLDAYEGYNKASQEKVRFIFQKTGEGSKSREEIQEQLKGFMNNESILKELKDSGINIEEWLNYKKEKEFQLKDRDAEVKKSSLIEVPLDRVLSEGIDNYIDRLEILIERFNETEIENPRRIKIQKKLSEVKNEKAKQYIQKQLKAEPDKIKVRTYLEEIIQDVRESKKTIEGLSKKLQEKEEAGRNLKETKGIISELEGQCLSLNKKIKNLPEKINYLKEQVPLRKESIRQIFSEGIEDINNHIENDLNSLNSVFSEKESRFNNRKLTVKVWDRNPHVDAYLGNYMGCCISVESKSTLFDYLTDLGFQVVTMVDEKTKNPVVAAWCWLGKDEKTNETYLVVDNIEANTDYSSRFSETMWKEMISYIRDYAKKIKVGEVVMGSLNNDLEPKKETKDYKELIDHPPVLEKIGGFNGKKYYTDY